MSDVLLEAIDLVRHFEVGSSLFKKGKRVRAVDGVSLQVERGETFAIVGESGCGKSTLARLLMRLDNPTAGKVLFEGRETRGLKGKELTELRRDLQFIFQDPFSSLNPRITVGKLVGEPIEVHAPELDADARRQKVGQLLAQVGLLPEHANRYPHEFSGGQRQRIGIARALASGPRAIIGDEPVSALDVSVQAQVINLLSDLKSELKLTLLIIAHDLAVVRHMSDRVAVMYLGQIVEIGPADAVFETARHPYTRALLSSIPEPQHNHKRNPMQLTGETPSPLAPPSGCRFHTRCPFVQDNCKTTEPQLDEAGQGHSVACHHWRDIGKTAPPEQMKPRSENVAKRFAMYQAAVNESVNDSPENIRLTREE